MSARPGRAAAVIPVRVDSQRLPGKALLEESGQPLFLHTCDRAREAGLDEVWVATDDDRVDAAARAAGYLVARTSERPRTGSERCAEALADIDADLVIDVQGDWPEVEPGDLRRLATALAEGAPCATLAVPESERSIIDNPNVVKVVRALDGSALYFSRALIPHAQRDAGARTVLRHVGVYGFRRETLAGVPELPSSGLAETESLEQLRFLENGIRIAVLDATGAPWGIETRADYDQFLSRRQLA